MIILKKNKVFIHSLLVVLLLFVNTGAITVNGSIPPRKGNVVMDERLSISQLLNGREVTIRMGMSKAKVDKLLGKPEAFRSPDGGAYYKYGDHLAGYSRGQLAMFEWGENAYISAGVSMASSQTEVLDKLGPPSIPGTLAYGYRWDSKKAMLRQLKAEELKQYEGRADYYELSLSTTFYGDLSGIQIVRGDFRASMMKRIKRNNESLLEKDPIKQLTVSDLSVAPEGTHSYLSLGMTRKEAEKILGKPTGELFFGYTRYDGIGVGYRDDKVAAFMLQMNDNAKTIFRTPQGVGLSASKKAVEKLYGKPTSPTLNYVLVKDGPEENLRVMQENEQRRGDYVISMNVTRTSDDELVNFLLIGDFSFAMTNT